MQTVPHGQTRRTGGIAYVSWVSSKDLHELDTTTGMLSYVKMKKTELFKSRATAESVQLEEYYHVFKGFLTYGS